ncbi:hypothetical protein NUU61_006896 [Penicillium alfredii]|uniref:Peptidase S8/S53 domain-containing protein n=1 Tax=Penicillium alfredii TaxID=1506179 RepID=A0A9W9K477_9EURO|nr:uncharacterized protein NUU61_006896 [Penicillium alfredii]KAJ5092026.1 hypothetical protein NUU61_006896 [Penicillium alfredii]
MSLRWLIATSFALFTILINALPPQRNSSENPELYSSEHSHKLDKRARRPRLRSQNPAFFYLAAISRAKTKTPDFDPPGSMNMTSFDTKTAEYKSWDPEPRWIISKPIPRGETDHKDDPDGHGTCVGSLISSPKYGVAKGASLVIVKTPFLYTPFSKMTDTHAVNFLNTLWDVAKDIKAVLKDKPYLKGKIFVNFSAGISKKLADWLGPQDMNDIKKAFKEIDKLAMVYVAAGNRYPLASKRDNSRATLFEEDALYPERWRGELPHTTFVAMADEDGLRSRWSLMPAAGALWAVSEYIPCAPLHGQQVKKEKGTSLATPQAAALAAYAATLPYKPFYLPNPQEDFDGYVAELQWVLESSSWRLQGARGVNSINRDDHRPAVPLISNRFCERVKGEGLLGCGCG